MTDDKKDYKVTKLTSKDSKSLSIIISIGMILVVASIAYSTAIIINAGEDLGSSRFLFLAPQFLFAIVITGIAFIRGLVK